MDNKRMRREDVEERIITEEHKHEERMVRRDLMLPLSVVVAGIVIAVAVVYSTGVSNLKPQGGAAVPAAGKAPEIGNAVILGNPSAPVTMIEFGDFQCPFCGRFFAQTEPQIIDKYVRTGKVKLAYKDYAFLGPESLAAAEAAQCAAEQGKFWAYHDALYTAEQKDGEENNGNLARPLFMTLAKNTGLDEARFGSCLDAQKYKSAVDEELAEAKAVGVSGTPYFFINGQPLSGALPLAQFESVIEQALQKSGR